MSFFNASGSSRVPPRVSRSLESLGDSCRTASTGSPAKRWKALCKPTQASAGAPHLQIDTPPASGTSCTFSGTTTCTLWVVNSGQRETGRMMAIIKHLPDPDKVLDKWLAGLPVQKRLEGLSARDLLKALSAFGLSAKEHKRLEGELASARRARGPQRAPRKGRAGPTH